MPISSEWTVGVFVAALGGLLLPRPQSRLWMKGDSGSPYLVTRQFQQPSSLKTTFQPTLPLDDDD